MAESGTIQEVQTLQRVATTSVVDHSRDGESRFTEILIILVVGAFMSTTAVALRAFTRVKMLRTFGVDDFFMVVAQVLVLGAAVAIGLETRFGLGRHSWVQPQEDFIPYMKSFYVSIVLYNIATTVVKLSILLQYRRIFANSLMQKLTTWGLVIISSWTIMLCFLLPMMCMPVASFWDKTVPGRCINLLASWYTMAIFNIVADFFMFSLPIPVINSLQLPKRQKRLLLFVFGLGFGTCIISAFRINTLSVAAKTEDPFWDNVDAATWSFLEVTIGILAACLPTLRPIFVSILPRFFNGSSSHTSKNQPSQYNNPYGRASQTKKALGAGHEMGRHQPLGSTDGLSYQSRDDIEMSGADTENAPEYSVTVSTGALDAHEKTSGTKTSWFNGNEDNGSKGHIRTTTVVTQQVTIDSTKRAQLPL